MAQAPVQPPTLAVQRLAPHLVAFAGSPVNFQSLVSGLAAGTQVQLVTTLPGGLTQVATFTPAAALTPSDIVQALESARQRLIGLGIASPTAEQVSFALAGGVVPTAFGGAPVAGALNPQNPPSPAAQLQQQSAAAGATSPAVAGGVTVQLFPNTLPGAQPPATTPTRANTSDSPTVPGSTSRSPAPPISATPSPATPAPIPGAAAAAATAPAPERVPAARPQSQIRH